MYKYLFFVIISKKHWLHILLKYKHTYLIADQLLAFKAFQGIEDYVLHTNLHTNKYSFILFVLFHYQWLI